MKIITIKTDSIEDTSKLLRLVLTGKSMEYGKSIYETELSEDYMVKLDINESNRTTREDSSKHSQV